MVLEKLMRSRDPEALAIQVRQLYQDEKIEKIVLDKAQTYLTITRQLEDGDVDSSLEAVLMNRIRNVLLEEYIADTTEGVATQQLLRMWRMIEEEGFSVSYIVAGHRQNFEKWLGLRFPRVRAVTLFGVPVVFSTQVPAEAIIVCGTSESDAPPTDVQFSVKSLMG